MQNNKYFCYTISENGKRGYGKPILYTSVQDCELTRKSIEMEKPSKVINFLIIQL